mmetsp:Transcript_22049/g.50386  ORF Transcript_22049/g.50386 Transcript_22049/m.50386 type:complete len:355 (-) Transcript_22049:200-1264(-)
MTRVELDAHDVGVHVEHIIHHRSRVLLAAALGRAGRRCYGHLQVGVKQRGARTPVGEAGLPGPNTATSGHAADESLLEPICRVARCTAVALARLLVARGDVASTQPGVLPRELATGEDAPLALHDGRGRLCPAARALPLVTFVLKHLGTLGPLRASVKLLWHGCRLAGFDSIHGLLYLVWIVQLDELQLFPKIRVKAEEVFHLLLGHVCLDRQLVCLPSQLGVVDPLDHLLCDGGALGVESPHGHPLPGSPLELLLGAAVLQERVHLGDEPFFECRDLSGSELISQQHLLRKVLERLERVIVGRFVVLGILEAGVHCCRVVLDLLNEVRGIRTRQRSSRGRCWATRCSQAGADT